ncbi:MAG: hypothetical protein GXO93_07840 [FCB group bacterium]|nr:hypothetical protein [FCB group bacterium]
MMLTYFIKRKLVEKLPFPFKKMSVFSSENPWDGAILITGKRCLSLSKKKNKYLIIGMALFTWAVVFFSVHAQSSLPPNEDLEKQQNTAFIALNRNEREIAGDYQDFLKQLKKIAQDYHGYFAQLDNSKIEQYQKELYQIIKNINRGNYYLDINQLSNDLHKLNKGLSTGIDTINQSSDNRTLKELIKSLHLELSLLDRVLKEEITPQLQKNKRDLIFIQSYLLQAKIKDYKTALKENRLKLNQTKLSKTLKKLKLLQTHLQNQTSFLLTQKNLPPDEMSHLTDSLNQVNILILPEIDSLIPPFPPTINEPQHSEEIYPNDRYINDMPSDQPDTNSSGKSEMVKVIIDSIRIPSSNQIIKIKNQTGTLKITGWF